jgi:hypothetical protein
MQLGSRRQESAIVSAWTSSSGGWSSGRVSNTSAAASSATSAFNGRPLAGTRRGLARRRNCPSAITTATTSCRLSRTTYGYGTSCGGTQANDPSVRWQTVSFNASHGRQPTAPPPVTGGMRMRRRVASPRPARPACPACPACPARRGARSRTVRARKRTTSIASAKNRRRAWARRTSLS